MNKCPSCHRRDGLNPRAEVLQCVYCGWEPVADVIHDMPPLDVCREDDLPAHLVDEGLLAWDKLLETSSHTKRFRSPVLVIMEDSPIHTDSYPFCRDESCPCHVDDELFDEYVMRPMLAGLLTSYEASRMMWGE